MVMAQDFLFLRRNSMTNELQQSLFKHLNSLHRNLEKYESMINAGEGSLQHNQKMLEFYMGEIKVIREKLLSSQASAGN
jgi:hypothetical protein